MEYSQPKLSLVLFLLSAALLLLVAVDKAEAICNMTDEKFEACKPAVISGPSQSEPSAECCSALDGADLDCLCSYRNSVLLPSLGIDPDRAMQLPKECGLATPEDCS